MKTDHDQVEDLLNQALAFSPDQRTAFLAGACGSDNVLRSKVETLLKAHGEADGFLPEAPSALIAAVSESGTVIDKYKLLEKLGEGGFGVVYMAEQSEPVKRRVALKIIKIGMDTREVVARFETERQALAMMDHPNIAKVFDGGATATTVVGQASRLPTGSPARDPGKTGETPAEAGKMPAPLPSGRPYFVMELVRGIKITDYCDEKKLSTRERLDLFIKVCQAVQHAHQKGIIHRDLKPSNILVTVNDGVAVPKIIDFGIAKATQAELTGKTVFTRFHHFLGTPSYMSPEQAEMTSLDIDTRSDIYSLGVLLYELLTGKTPFDAEELLKAGLDEMRRTIREKEPARPSTRVSTLRGDELTTTAKRRGLDAPKLINLLCGDLDWIAMKCLEKDRARRYETANGLASDVQRHLSNEPVIARPPTVTYRLQKLVRRNRLAFAAAGIVTTALVVGLGAALWQSIEKTRAYNRAVAAETAAKTAAAKSEQVAQFLQDMLKGVGTSVALGRDTTMLREILDKTTVRISVALTNQPEVEVELLNTIGGVQGELGQLENAEASLRRALAIVRHRLSKEHDWVATLLNSLATVLRHRGKLAEAESISREALEMEQNLHGKEHVQVAMAVHTLASVLQNQGRLPEAETRAREALEMRRKLWGRENAEVAESIGMLAGVLYSQGKLAEAETLSRNKLEMSRKLLGNEDVVVAIALNNLGVILLREDKLGEAENAFREALRIYTKFLGNEHPQVATSINNLAGVLNKQGKLAEAETMLREALALYRKLLGNEHPNVAAAIHNLAAALRLQGKLAEAETLQLEALALFQKLLGNEHPDVVTALASLAYDLQAQGKLVEAENRYRQALEMGRKLLGDDHPEVTKTINNLVVVLQKERKLGEAETLSREQLPDLRSRLPADDPNLANALITLTDTLLAEGKFIEAEPIVRECLSIREKKLPDDWRTFNTKSMLGGSLLGQKKYSEAEPLLLSGYEGLKQREAKITNPYRVRLKEAMQRLVELYDATGRPDQAAEWKKKLEEFEQTHNDN